MSSLGIAVTVFACCFGAALVGMVLHKVVPDRHLDSDSKDVVKLVMGLIATMAALVLGLLIASAKASYDAEQVGLQQLAVELIEMDQRLAHFGPETKEIRGRIRQQVSDLDRRIWEPDGVEITTLDPGAMTQKFNDLYGAIQKLTVTSDDQREDQSEAEKIAFGISHTRIVMFVDTTGQLATPFLVVLVLWVSMLFMGFGIFARFNPTVTVSVMIGAVCVSGAVFLILELNSPFSGLVRLSDAPIRYALARIGQ